MKVLLSIKPEFVEKIFDENTNTLSASNVKATNKVYANTVVANNILINLDNGKTLSLAEILEKLNMIAPSDPSTGNTEGAQK